MTELEAMKILKARERQEDRSVPTRLDRSRWDGCEYCKGATGWTQDLDEEHHEVEFLFCPVCGRPLTEEAWAELERRIAVAPPPNDPLTLEQLREMDGDKIYVHYIDGFYTDEDGAYFGKFEQLVRECNGKLTACELPLEYYGKTWLAYRRRPEEVNPHD